MVEVELEWENFDAAFDELEKELTDVARGLTVRTWDSILSRTPQFLGQMVASYSYSINGPAFENRWQLAMAANLEKLEQDEPFTGLWRGHPVAIGIANAANAGRDAAFRLGDTVFISNAVDHGEGPYSADLEAGNIHLRAVNLPGAPVARTLDWISVRYDDITPSQAAALRGRHLGGANAQSDS